MLLPQNENSADENIHNQESESLSTQQEVANTISFTIDAVNDKLCEAIFKSSFADKLEDVLNFTVSRKLLQVDVLMLYRFGFQQADALGLQKGIFNEIVGQPQAMEDFAFFQSASTAKDIMMKTEFPKFFLSVRIEKVPDEENRYIVKPFLLQIPQTTSMTLDGLIYAKEITSAEELSAIEQTFA